MVYTSLSEFVYIRPSVPVSIQVLKECDLLGIEGVSTHSFRRTSDFGSFGALFGCDREAEAERDLCFGFLNISIPDSIREESVRDSLLKDILSLIL